MSTSDRSFLFEVTFSLYILIFFVRLDRHQIGGFGEQGHEICSFQHAIYLTLGPAGGAGDGRVVGFKCMKTNSANLPYD